MTFEVSGVVVRYESVLFLLMYAVYIALMYFNRSIEAWIVPKFPSLSHEARPKSGEELKLDNMRSFVSAEQVTTNNNELSDVDIDSENAGQFTRHFSAF